MPIEPFACIQFTRIATVRMLALAAVCWLQVKRIEINKLVADIRELVIFPAKTAMNNHNNNKPREKNKSW